MGLSINVYQLKGINAEHIQVPDFGCAFSFPPRMIFTFNSCGEAQWLV
jgi:hypothetical protein